MGQLTDAVRQMHSRGVERADLESIREHVLRSDTKRLNCEVPVQVYKQLQIKAIQEDSSITGIINRLVLEYVNS
ncbi:MAG: hypothetical protein MI976_08060 [Pseudomonadales bacterium]|nr:hypothetical protein [Pseudomonadales bacterium]